MSKNKSKEEHTDVEADDETTSKPKPQKKSVKDTKAYKECEKALEETKLKLKTKTKEAKELKAENDSLLVQLREVNQELTNAMVLSNSTANENLMMAREISLFRKITNRLLDDEQTTVHQISITPEIIKDADTTK